MSNKLFRAVFGWLSPEGSLDDPFRATAPAECFDIPQMGVVLFLKIRPLPGYVMHGLPELDGDLGMQLVAIERPEKEMN